MGGKIINLIYKSVNELNEQTDHDLKLKKSTNTVLFGSKGEINSLGLVNLLVIIEQNIEDEFDISITIADERAMSQKHSPFRAVGALVDYINMLLNEI